jgi:hypothetical protein
MRKQLTTRKVNQTLQTQLLLLQSVLWFEEAWDLHDADVPPILKTAIHLTQVSHLRVTRRLGEDSAQATTKCSMILVVRSSAGDFKQGSRVPTYLPLPMTRSF